MWRNSRPPPACRRGLFPGASPIYGAELLMSQQRSPPACHVLPNGKFTGLICDQRRRTKLRPKLNPQLCNRTLTCAKGKLIIPLRTMLAQQRPHEGRPVEVRRGCGAAGTRRLPERIPFRYVDIASFVTCSTRETPYMLALSRAFGPRFPGNPGAAILAFRQLMRVRCRARAARRADDAASPDGVPQRSSRWHEVDHGCRL